MTAHCGQFQRHRRRSKELCIHRRRDTKSIGAGRNGGLFLSWYFILEFHLGVFAWERGVNEVADEKSKE